MLKILIVEDDLMIADRAEQMLTEFGYEVCGIARTVGNAVAMARRDTPDLALIDLRLADHELGSDIALQLKPLGKLGILYATGNVSQSLLMSAKGHACISKPYSSADLRRALELVTEIVETGTASPPFPHGFHRLVAAGAALGA